MPFVFHIIQLMVVGPPGWQYPAVQCLVEEEVVSYL